MTDEVLSLLPLLPRHDPAASALENDAVHLQVAFLPARAQHGEFLRLNQIFNNLAASGALVPACGFGDALGKTAVVLHLAGSADGIRRPIIGRWIAVGVEDFGLQIAEKSFGLGA